MENALETYRKAKGLSFAELGRLLGYDRSNVLRQCRAERLPEATATRCNVKLGIPMKALCPHLYRDES